MVCFFGLRPQERGVSSVLDVGCGTGTLCCLLARQGKEVTGLDPAQAELEIASAKPGGDRVRWLHAEASAIPPLGVDAATMTGNVAQVFLTDEDWAATLGAVWATLRPGGWFIFETRDPSHQAWLEWRPERSCQRIELPGLGTVASWVELTAAELPLISFRATFVFEAEGRTRTSDSTLRFRSRAEVESTLQAGGFTVAEVRDAPDRPGCEFVFLAQRGGP